MAQEAKLNGGPWNGKYIDVPDGDTRIKLTAPVELTRKQLWEDTGPDFPLQTRSGEYVRSYRVLANGTRVFQWMGWYDGKV